jgi:hypothetical protein
MTRRVISLVVIETLTRVMIHCDDRIVEQLPSGALDRQAQNQLEMHLRTLPAESLVEADVLDGAAPIAHVGTLEHVHLPRPTHAEVMVADNPAVPTDSADRGRSAGINSRICVDPVTATDPAYPVVDLDVSLDALKPVRSRDNVVVGEDNEISLRSIEPTVHGCDDPGHGHCLHPQLESSRLPLSD